MRTSVVHYTNMTVGKKKVIEITIAVAAGVVLLGSGFWLGWASGREYPTNIVVTGVSNINPTVSTTADFSTFWQAWQIINDDYLRNPSTTDQQKVYGAIGGLVDSLGDPYTEFFSPTDNQQFQQDITGNFGGIGAELGSDADGDVVIIAPIKGTPAAAAGLESNDIITAINGSSTEGMDVDDAVSLIRGNVGTPVTLSILREGWTAPRNFTMTRETIEVPNVDFTMKGDIADITLTEFTQDADSEFYNALVQAVNNNAQGIVLDLRDNPGGYLQVAVDLAGYFLKPGSPVVKEVGRSVPEEDYTSTGNGALDDVPMVILINNGSASAAEILAGALHDDRGIKLVGEHSFGKGTVQELETLADGSAIKLTVAHWVLPSGQILNYGVGLAPDYVVAEPTSTSGTTSQDPQLDKALQVLQAEITANQ